MKSCRKCGDSLTSYCELQFPRIREAVERVKELQKLKSIGAQFVIDTKRTKRKI